MRNTGTPHNLIRTLCTAALLCLCHVAWAHPMGNFSINHYTRIEAKSDALHLRTILDYAEIPTVAERSAMDADNDKQISPQEREAYLKTKSEQLKGNLSLSRNGQPVRLDLTHSALEFRPGAGGLDTLRLTLELVAPLESTLNGAGIAFRDGNYTERTGWKEIVAVGAPGVTLTSASVPAMDRSRELTAYPTDAATIPPQDTEAAFTVVQGNAPSVAPAGTGATTPRRADAAAFGSSTAPAVQNANNATPQDAFTQAIATKTLTFPILLVSLGLAFLFGAFHALSPGHGKAMVAAYLVGTRGTVKHAVFLGGVVTLTHTIGVFTLGVVTLLAARYIVPERLYPVLSGLSGLAIVGIGFGLLISRFRKFQEAEQEMSPELARDAERYAEFEPPVLPDRAPISLKTLIVLGITGGALPCPSALVVMLSAIALHRVAFGLALILAFSLGLAVVLTTIGILIVRARGFLERLPVSGRLVRQLPVISAALVTIIGFILLFRALHGNF